MDSSEAESRADFFLRDIPKVKIGQERKKEVVPTNHVREEIKVLHLSENSQQMVMETLKFIHGPEYRLSASSTYEDKQLQISSKYLKNSTLVIKGAFHHTEMNENSEAGKFKMFALLRLESYGFHKTHCLEALEYCQENMEDALCLLYTKYLGINRAKPDVTLSENELLEQKADEKSVLESIYESAFEEKFTNDVWIFKFDLEYLVNMFHPQRINKGRAMNDRTEKKKEMCRGFLRGHCKFGSKCRFSHHVENPTENKSNDHLNDFTFELEIRFTKDLKYPYESPVIMLKKNILLPELLNIHISKRLYMEAENFSRDGIPSIYSVVELLKNEDEMTDYLKHTPMRFPSSLEKLMQETNNKNRLEVEKYNRRGFTNKDNKKTSTLTEILTHDRRLAVKLKQKLQTRAYVTMLNNRKNLPAYNLRNDIINTVKSSQVTVISGETGCGKSTQVPQYFLEDWITNYDANSSAHIEIICTQPRRISAIGVAERVAEERAERVGDTVGYQIRLESKMSNSTRLCFCTTGILLRRLEYDPTLANVSHIIVDEVHERSEESDFLLLILKDLLKIRQDLKVILMSATLNSSLFSDYFGSVPVVNIPGRTFPVEQFYLEDVLDLIDYVMEENTQFTRKVKRSGTDEDLLNIEFESSTVQANCPRPDDRIPDEKLTFAEVLLRYREYEFKTCKNLYLMDTEKVNIDLIEAVLEWLISGDHDYPCEGSILVFVPGISEITTLYERLLNNSAFLGDGRVKYKLFPLHSSLTSEEQAAIFKTFKDTRKIILSTNLAETSVTINDCVYVLDCGKMKEKHFDSNRNMESLEMVWVTRANALQRKGRAGRVMPGYCFHLFTYNRFENQFLTQPTPEIHRVPLEQLLLHIKILPCLSDRNLYEVLESTLEPPVRTNIESAIIRLQNVGAFDKENNLTPLGHHLAMLPVDVRIGKLMLYGTIFSCIDSALTIAAALSHKSPFVSPFDKKEQAMAKKKEFSVGFSDHLTLLQVYKKWRTVSANSYAAGRNFAIENYLSIKTLETLADIKYQFLELLVNIGFAPLDLTSHRHRSGKDDILLLTKKELNQHSESIRLLNAVLCAALYPNIVKVCAPQTIYLKGASGAVPIEREAKQLRFRTQQETVFIHPSSVNFSVTRYHSPYLVYQEKVRTSKIYVRDCTMVPVIPLVLFSGSEVDICVNNGTTFVVLADGWIRFHVEDHQIAEMIKAIRIELLNLLEEKIKSPLLNLLHDERGERIINTIIHIATND